MLNISSMMMPILKVKVCFLLAQQLALFSCWSHYLFLLLFLSLNKNIWCTLLILISKFSGNESFSPWLHWSWMHLLCPNVLITLVSLFRFFCTLDSNVEDEKLSRWLILVVFVEISWTSNFWLLWVILLKRARIMT